MQTKTGEAIGFWTMLCHDLFGRNNTTVRNTNRYIIASTQAVLCTVLNASPFGFNINKLAQAQIYAPPRVRGQLEVRVDLDTVHGVAQVCLAGNQKSAQYLLRHY